MPTLTAYLRQNGVEVIQRDLNVEVFDEILSRRYLTAALGRLRRMKDESQASASARNLGLQRPASVSPDKLRLLIVAVNGTAGNIRITRANLLDELNKPYVETARAKGVKEGSLIWKYPVRVALNPFFSTVGWSLASLISGTTLVAMVLSLQTTGPMLLRSLTSQDMYLAGSFLFLLSALTIIGTLLSDILLAIVDPRIRLQ